MAKGACNGGPPVTEAAKSAEGYRAKQNRPKGTSLRKRRSGPSLTSKGYSDKAAKISWARDRLKWIFFVIICDRDFYIEKVPLSKWPSAL